jgi:Acyclic terpene utilisation family protein AtuA
MKTPRKIRIGSGLGFYGDSWQPVRASIERGDVQYIGSDHLAELTLAILQKDRVKDAALGYARDMLPMLAELYPLGRERGVKFMLNAGGLNPRGACAALAESFRKLGLHAKIAVVTGDSVLGRVDELIAAGESLAHLDTGAGIAAVRERLVFASAYLGARPMVEALKLGADIVITGRVADAALFLAPLVHEFKWSWDDYGKLAQGLTVGHLLECSGQASGGNFGGDWQSVPDIAHIGYPIAEVSADGTAVITKPPGTGGLVNFDTVRQQLLYEVHDPRSYFSPDVVLDMSTLVLTDLGDNRVEVKGASGKPRPDKLKIVGGYHDGYMGEASLAYSWPEALKKARATAAIVRTQLAERNIKCDELHVEYLGYNALFGAVAEHDDGDDLNEVFLRMAIRSKDKRVAEGFRRLFPWLALSGPPFVTGGGIQGATELIAIWPTLVRRELVEDQVKIEIVEV